MKYYLLYNQFFSYDNPSERKLGGIETYMQYLSFLLMKMGNYVTICQFSRKEFTKEYEGIIIKGFEVDSIGQLYKRVEYEVVANQAWVIFMSDSMSIRTNYAKVLSIQHGISWDKPYLSGSKLLNSLKRLKNIRKAIRDFNNCDYRVCVDYNFYNWYKTFCPNILPSNLWVVPNFTEKVISDSQLREKLASSKEKLRIIFARRFEEYRGALLFCKVALKILDKYPNVRITFAGEGPLEMEMKNILLGYEKRVDFIKYLPSDSFDVHLKHDIAVVPTIGSEGTSLSLLEAMGAGCCVVATPVGGMSNIIIDGYNGFLSMPNEDDLEIVMEKAIKSYKSESLIAASVATVREGFSLYAWETRWKRIFDFLVNRIK